jgi:hypothetical protein
MTFRRLVSTGEKYEKFKQDIQNYIKGMGFKINYSEIKVKIIDSPKPNTVVIDISGEGADTVAKKFKDIGGKYYMNSIIKNQKTLSPRKI